MLTIIVGDAAADVKEDLEPSSLRFMPDKLVKFFTSWLESGASHVIRVYSDTLLNYTGYMIENGELMPDQVEVITEYGTHYFDARGVLDSSWPYGIFNWNV